MADTLKWYKILVTFKKKVYNKIHRFVGFNYNSSDHTFKNINKNIKILLKNRRTREREEGDVK